MASIEYKEDILGGKLVFKGTRVPVKNLFDYLLDGETIEDFLIDFPTVSHEQVKEVLNKVEDSLQKELLVA